MLAKTAERIYEAEFTVARCHQRRKVGEILGGTDNPSAGTGFGEIGWKGAALTGRN